MGGNDFNSVLAVYYFRDLEGLDRFAADPLHKKAWNWYDASTSLWRTQFSRMRRAAEQTEQATEGK